MKKLLAILVSSAFVLSFAIAQEKGEKGEKMETKTKMATHHKVSHVKHHHKTKHHHVAKKPTKKPMKIGSK